MAVKSYRELIAWQRAMDFAEAVYRETGDFPLEETYGLRAQVRRSAVSVPSNIAEGQGRKSTREFLHRLSIAHGSLAEAETQILLSQRLGYLRDSAADDLLQAAAEVGRLERLVCVPRGEGREPVLRMAMITGLATVTDLWLVATDSLTTGSLATGYWPLATDH